MKFKSVIGKILYKTIGNLLPDSSKGKVFRHIRAYFGKMVVGHCGRNTNFGKRAAFSHLVSLGDNSGIGNRAFLQGSVVIGKNVMMADDVKIFTRNHAFSRLDIPMCEQGTQNERKVIIGDDVWIGTNVIILPGSRIGNGVVLGAGSVIRGDVPDFAVVIGNPGRIIKFRNKGISYEANTDSK